MSPTTCRQRHLLLLSCPHRRAGTVGIAGTVGMAVVGERRRLAYAISYGSSRLSWPLGACAKRVFKLSPPSSEPELILGRSCSQTKLGIKQNPIAPFGSTSRKTSYSGDPSLSPGPFPRRKSSLGDLNSQLHRSPPTPEPRDRPATGSSPLSAYSSGGLPGPGSVALNRALVSNEGGVETLQSPPEHNDTSSSSTSSSLPKPNGTRLSSTAAAENPFFGSGQSSRERMSKSAASSQSGSGKVISGLQSDLLQARSALESTRGQLRLSQRAVEHLGRQTGTLSLFRLSAPQRADVSLLHAPQTTSKRPRSDWATR